MRTKPERPAPDRPTAARDEAGTEPEEQRPGGGASGTPGGGHAAAARSEIREGILYCVKVFVAVRLALAVIALMSVALLPDFSSLPEDVEAEIGLVPEPVAVPGWPAEPVTPGWHNLFTSWERFDALWYLRIADGGYASGDGTAAFFPLYPLAIRALSFAMGGRPFAAGLLVSNAAFLGALILFYLLGRADVSDSTARRAVLYLSVFPSAFFLVAPYSESLFLLLTLLAFWGARRGRWEVAGIAGLLAALTRSVGLLLVVPLLAEAIHQALASRPRRWPIRALVWSAAPAFGTALYLRYWQVVSGDFLAPLHQQASWQRELTNPAGTLASGTREAFRWIGQYSGGYHLLDWLIAVPVVLAAGYAVVRFRPSYGLYAVASIVVPLTFIFSGRPLMSFPRFALTVFPVFWAFAVWTSRTLWRHEAFVAVSAALLGLMTLLFVNWYYVF
jgi:Gpi18-like mannosyltransferase